MRKITFNRARTILVAAVTLAAVNNIVFAAAPSVVSINRDTPTAQDTNAATVIFRVTFSTNVTGVDPTDFTITTINSQLPGTTIGTVTPISGSVYTVSVNVGSGAAVIRLDLIDDDSIKDSGNTPLGGSGAGNGNFQTGQTYRVDNTPLTVTINQGVNQADPTRVNSINFTALFNKTVNDFTNASVALSGTASGGTVGVTNSGDNQTYTVTVSGMPTNGSGDGTVIVSIPANQVHDAAGNGNAASTSDDNSVTFDTTKPTVTNVVSVSFNGMYGIGTTVRVGVVFSEIVVVTGTPQLFLATGGAGTLVNYTSGSGYNTLEFDYTVASGDATPRLDFVSAAALALNGGTITDQALNTAILTLPAPGAPGSLGYNARVVIDGIAPVVTSVTSTQANGTYRVGASMTILVHFSESVTVTGTPQLELKTGASNTLINYVSGSGTTALAFQYTVVPGNNSADLDYAATSSLTLNGGTIRDAANNDAILTLPAPGAAGSLSANGDLVIDTKPHPNAPTPATGTTAGGTTLTITGSNLTQATVTFGGAAATINGGTDSTIFITTPPHAGGPVDVVVAVLGGTATLTNAYTYNAPPVVNGTGTISPTPTLAGRPVTVTPSVTDPEGATLTYIYNWGDGTAPDSTGTHVYTAAGTYTVTITVTDGINTVSYTVTITVQPDFLLIVKSLIGSYKPAKGSKLPDSVSLTAVLNNLPAGFMFAGKTMNLNIGGVKASFVLDARGSGSGPNKSSVKTKATFAADGSVLAGPVTITVKLFGSFVSTWSAVGIDPTMTYKNATIKMPVECAFVNGAFFSGDTLPSLSGTPAKGGKFSFQQK